MARERLIKWNNEILTFNNKYIRPKDLTTDVPPAATYPTDQLRTRFIFADNLNDSYGSYNGTVTGGSLSYAATSFNASFKAVSPATGSDKWQTASGMMDFSSADFSVSFWAYHANTTADKEIIIANGTGGALNALQIKAGYWNGTDDTEYGFDFSSGTANCHATSTNGAWHHIVMTYKTGTKQMNLYIDNGSPTNSTASGECAWSGQLIVFYNWGSGVYTPTADKLALLYFYQKELSASEVSQLYNSGIGV